MLPSSLFALAHALALTCTHIGAPSRLHSLHSHISPSCAHFTSLSPCVLCPPMCSSLCLFFFSIVCVFYMFCWYPPAQLPVEWMILCNLFFFFSRTIAPMRYYYDALRPIWHSNYCTFAPISCCTHPHNVALPSPFVALFLMPSSHFTIYTPHTVCTLLRVLSSHSYLHCYW